MRESALVWLSRPIKTYLAILDQFGPIFDLFWAKIGKNHIQFLKMCGNVVSFDSLGLLIRFWPFWVNFGPNLAKIGQI